MRSTVTLPKDVELINKLLAHLKNYAATKLSKKEEDRQQLISIVTLIYDYLGITLENRGIALKTEDKTPIKLFNIYELIEERWIQLSDQVDSINFDKLANLHQAIKELATNKTLKKHLNKILNEINQLAQENRTEYASVQPLPPIEAQNLVSDEILLHIFSYLLPQELITVTRVCKQFNRVAQDVTLWRPHLARVGVLLSEQQTHSSSKGIKKQYFNLFKRSMPRSNMQLFFKTITYLFLPIEKDILSLDTIFIFLNHFSKMGSMPKELAQHLELANLLRYYQALIPQSPAFLNNAKLSNSLLAHANKSIFTNKIFSSKNVLAIRSNLSFEYLQNLISEINSLLSSITPFEKNIKFNILKQKISEKIATLEEINHYNSLIISEMTLYNSSKVNGKIIEGLEEKLFQLLSSFSKVSLIDPKKPTPRTMLAEDICYDRGSQKFMSNVNSSLKDSHFLSCQPSSSGS